MLVRETFSRQPIKYSKNMDADEKDLFIQYLVDKDNTYEVDKRARVLKFDQQVKFARKNKRLIFSTLKDRALQSALNHTYAQN